jgi:hypothetical protein
LIVNKKLESNISGIGVIFGMTPYSACSKKLLYDNDLNFTFLRGATAIGHVTAVFGAMFGTAAMCSRTRMARTSCGSTTFRSGSQMLIAVVAIAGMGFSAGSLRTMFGAGLIFFAGMCGTMLGAVVFCIRFMYVAVLGFGFSG